MPDEVIKIVVDDLQALRSVDGLAEMLGRANMNAVRLGTSLDAAFKRATISIDSAGNVIKSKLDMSTVERGMGRASSSVDTFGQSVQRSGGHMESFGRRVSGIASGILVWEAFRTVTEIIQETIKAQADYSISVARFAVITEQSVGSAIAQYKELQDVAVAGGIKPSEAAPAIQRIGQFTRVPEEQQLILDLATNLQKVTGIDISEAADQLLTILKQTGEPASALATYGDLIAASFGKIPGTAEDFFDALSESVPLAQMLGVTTEQAYAAILGASAASGEAVENTANAVSRLTKGFNDLAMGGEKSADIVARLKSDFGIDPFDPITHTLREIPELLSEVASALPGLSAQGQQDLIQTIVGGSVKPDQLRTILGALQAFAEGLTTGMGDVSGALSSGAEKIDEAAGQIIKVIQARKEQLYQEGHGLTGALTDIAMALGGVFGGAPGAAAAGTLVTGGYQTASEAAKEKFLRSTMGMSKDDADKAISDWNSKVRESIAKAAQDAMATKDPLMAGAAAIAISQARSLLVSPEEAAAAISGVGRGTPVAPGVVSRSRQMNMPGAYAAGQTPRAGVNLNQFGQPIAPAPPPSVAPTEEERQTLAERARLTMFKYDTATGKPSLTGESIFSGVSELDATKLSMDEINQAIERGKALWDAQLQAQVDMLRMLGFTNEEIQKYISQQQASLDLTIQQVRMEGEKVKLYAGPEAEFLKRGMQAAPKKEESDFAFRRLKDVSPSQFPQLQALAQMYNAMLTQMGSPEKNKNINLLLGEENVFKTLNVRMSALQMAMEDLTKVEKAQLSGTWNLPAGATALVPISSLDIQRGFGQGGGAGGFDPASFMAMLKEMGLATGASGGATGGYAEPVSKRRVVRGGMEREESLEESRVRGMEDIRMRRIRERDQLTERTGRTLADPEALARQAAQRTARGQFIAPGRVGGGGAGARAENVVSVNLQPLRIPIQVSTNVMISGQVIARALTPFLATLLARAARSTGNTSGNTLRNIRG